jgi:hypothetical protein
MENSQIFTAFLTFVDIISFISFDPTTAGYPSSRDVQVIRSSAGE